MKQRAYEEDSVIHPWYISAKSEKRELDRSLKPAIGFKEGLGLQFAKVLSLLPGKNDNDNDNDTHTHTHTHTGTGTGTVTDTDNDNDNGNGSDNDINIDMEIDNDL